MNVVIIGGSFSGLSVAVSLSRTPPKKDTIITLIEPKAYLEIRWATIRAMFEESVSKGSTVAMSKILSSHKSIRHIRASAIGLDIDSVLLDNGQAIYFDVVLVATGSTTGFSVLTPHLTPGTPLSEGEAISARRRFLRDTGEKILTAKSVLVIGGGPVGTELAADVAAYGKRRGRQLRVTLIDSKERLIPYYSRSAGDKLEEKLSALGVDVLLKHRAVMLEDGTWSVEETAMPLKADFVIKANGVRPTAPQLFGENSESVRDGWIRTDHFGRVFGTRGNIFAAGDCCDWKAKSGENTLSNRHVYAHNIRVTVDALGANRALAAIDGKLRRVSTERNLAIVTSGPKDGVAALPLGSLTLFLPWMKNRGMFLAKAKKEIGWWVILLNVCRLIFVYFFQDDGKRTPRTKKKEGQQVECSKTLITLVIDVRLEQCQENKGWLSSSVGR